MVSLLLAVIYVAFISLGLPDALLGSGWPSMYQQLNVPISYAGIINMIIAGGTIVSSFFSDKMTRKLKTGMVTLLSVAMTAVALIGLSFSTSFLQLCLWAIPYGLGAGAVDAALNNFVALNYKAKHMNWLHCFWGVGAAAGPYIMGAALTRGSQWTAGYRMVSIIQFALVGILVLSLPLWQKTNTVAVTEMEETRSLTLAQTIGLPGAKPIFLAFFCYCAVESTTGLWVSSYLVVHRGMNPQTAASWTSLFFLGITVGRLLSGFAANRMSNKSMIRLGQSLIMFGALLLFIPFIQIISLVGILSIGLGCAPIFPSLLHDTPENFGSDKSQAIMGIQMASAYVGTTLVPPLFGVIADRITISVFPVVILTFAMVMLIMTEQVNKMRQCRKVRLTNFSSQQNLATDTFKRR